MQVRLQQDCAGIDWQAVQDLLKRAGMATYPPQVHRRAFHASYAVVFAVCDSGLCGCGRALCDGAYQAAFYDIAVDPAVQGGGVGRRMVEALLAAVPQCNVILYATPGKEGFYRKMEFRALQSGMGCFIRPDLKAQKGFTD